jgi:environmental stress-induced protein Ves
LQFKIIKASDWKVRPWKNGGGKTIELAIFPEDSEFSEERFLWRVSLALVEKTGPFSLFPQFERGIIQILGEPLALVHPDQPPISLKLFEPYLFSGDLETQCELKTRGTQAADLNAMVRDGWGELKMSYHEVSPQTPAPIVPSGGTSSKTDALFVYCCKGRIQVGASHLNERESLLGQSEEESDVTPLQVASKTPQSSYILVEILRSS